MLTVKKLTNPFRLGFGQMLKPNGIHEISTAAINEIACVFHTNSDPQIILRKEFPTLNWQRHQCCRHFSSKTVPNTNSATETIYTGKFKSRIIRVKIFSLATSFAAMYAQPILWQQGVQASGTGLGVTLCTMAGFFTFVTPLLLHFVTKKYVIDIQYNKEKDEYTATTVSLFLMAKRTTFKTEDIKIPEIEGMFTSMTVGPKKIPLFVDVESFTDTHHYARFMGYDKPVDYVLNADSSNSGASAMNKK